MKSKAIFLDRDGVINKHSANYVKSVDEFCLLPTVSDAIRIFNSNNYKVIVITNQSVINRNIITENELTKIHEYMLGLLNKNNCIIDKIYYCPHRPDENCTCRKPNTAMLEHAINDFNIDAKSSWLIGDSDTDIEAGKKMKINTIKITQNGKLIDIIDKLHLSK